MTRNATLGAVAVALLVVASGLTVAVGASPTAVGTDEDVAADASPVPQAQETTTTQGNETNATAELTFGDQNTNGSSVVVEQANLSAGGFVVVFAQNGTALGNSSYLEPGAHENVSVSLDVPVTTAQVLIGAPHLDTNDNRTFDFNATQAAEVGPANATDRPYLMASGLPVTEVAFVTVGNETRRRTTTA
jgi:hypothetical protein